MMCKTPPRSLEHGVECAQEQSLEVGTEEEVSRQKTWMKSSKWNGSVKSCLGRRKWILHWRRQYSITRVNNVSFEQNQGAEEEGDEMQYFPHSLEFGDGCGSKKNLEKENVVVGKLGRKHGRSKKCRKIRKRCRQSR